MKKYQIIVNGEKILTTTNKEEAEMIYNGYKKHMLLQCLKAKLIFKKNTPSRAAIPGRKRGNNMTHQKFSWIDIPESELLKKGLCDEYEFFGYITNSFNKYETVRDIYLRTGIKFEPTYELESDYKYTIDGETHYVFIF